MESHEQTTSFFPSSVSYENTTWSPDEVALYLSNLSEESFKQRYPVVVYLSILILLGLVGNSLVLAVYARCFPPSATRIFVLSMAICDLFTNIVGLPLQITTIRFAYNTYNYWLCRSFFACATLPTQASGLLLVLVAIERYRRICRPLEKQLNTQQALKLVIITVILSSVVFAFFVPMYGLHTVPTEISGVSVSMCWIEDDFQDTPYARVYSIIVGIVFFGGLLVMGVLYSLIGKQVWKQTKIKLDSKQLNTSAKESGESVQGIPPCPTGADVSPMVHEIESSEASLSGDHAASSQPLDTSESEPAIAVFTDSKTAAVEGMSSRSVMTETRLKDKVLEGKQVSTQNTIGVQAASIKSQLSKKPPTEDDSNESATQTSCFTASTEKSVSKVPCGTTKNFARKRSEHIKYKQGQKLRSRTTLMMAMLTAFYVINWLPHLIMRSVRRDPVNMCDNWTECGWNTYALTIRTYYINSAVNAFVYGFCNVRFRFRCRVLLQSCFNRKR